LEHGQAHVASSTEEREDADKKRLNNCLKKQWRTFKVGGVKRKGRASLGHDRCWKYLLCAITKHGEAKRDFEFIGEDTDRQLESLWRETKIGDVLPWKDIADEAEGLLAISKASRNAAHGGHDDGKQENDQELERDETDTYYEVILGEGDLIPSWLIGPIRSILCWDSSVHRIKDETTGSGENLEQWPNSTSSSEASKE
jgi:hypothetical protein